MHIVKWLGVLLAVFASLPAISVAQEQGKISVLMLGDSGFHKPSEFYRMLTKPLSKEGVELTYTEQLSDINPDNLARFDGLLVFANIERITPEAESALLNYVQGGGGLIPVHCGSFCFLNSDKYIELVGGQFRSHGFTRFETKVVAPDHEIMQGLSPVRSMDESYRHSRLNPDKVVLETRSAESGPVSDPDGEPYTWVRTSGKGRVFYTAWGHDYRTWSNIDFQRLLARGVLWACGQTLTPASDADQNVDPRAQAVLAANRRFEVPEMTPPSVDEARFSSTDVGAKIPNYTPGARWGTQDAPLTQMQDPLPAETSIHAYETPKGFQLSIWAKESDDNWPDGSQQPTVYAGLKGKPIAMNWDENGRLWLCETVDYPNELQTSEAQGRDRIKICEDTDNDGHADKFTVFAENLSIPSTLVCYRGGVIVQDGQTTVYMKDIDGDNRADFRQALITGWAMGDTHGGVSNFQYGPDNWIWAMQGYNNSQPVINGETQMRFRQGFWRFKVHVGAADETAPAYAISNDGQVSSQQSSDFNSHTIRVEALEFLRATNNNTWGLGFSEEGYVFGSTANGCPSVHMPIPNRYFDQVAGWSPTTLEQISPTHQFKPIDKDIRQVDWHGGFTAGCGSAIYTARNYPQAWWNRIQMVCGPTGNLVGAFVLEKEGAGYRSYNAFNTVASIDDWSAPIMSEVGPDGNVWFIDWYNYIVQHNPTPNGFQTGKGAAYESDLRDKRFARVYRLLYEDTKDSSPSRSLQLADASNADLVKALQDKNFFWRRTSQRLLVERGATDAATLTSLVSLVSAAEVDEIGLAPAAMHAIWTLAGLADSGDAGAAEALAKACEAGLKHVSSPVRNAAVSACKREQLVQAIKSGVHKDIDPRVRLTALLRVADGDAGKALPGGELSSLVSDVGNDDILLNAWTAAAATDAVETIVALTGNDTPTIESEQIATRVGVLAEHIARNNPTADQIGRLLDTNPNSPLAVTLWNGLAKGWPRDSVVKISREAQQKVRERFLSEQSSVESKAAILSVADKWAIENLSDIVDEIQDELLTVALNTDTSAEKRLDAWDQAIRLSPSSPKLLDATEQLLTPQLAPETGVAAINSLEAARVDGLSQQLLELRQSLGPKLGSQILTFLLSRTDSTQHLLDAVENGKVRFSDLKLDQRQAILNHPTSSIASRAAELMKSQGALVTSNRQALVDEWMPVTKNPGDATNGLAMFKKHCAACHIHGELGVAIGPNLTGMAVHPKEELLVNVLDPSRSVETNFQIYQVITVDGLVISGMLAGESANSIRVIDSEGKEKQVLREDIDQLVSSPKSLMPEGFESSMTKTEMTDLLAFLAQRGKYTPLTISKVATVNGNKGLPGFRNRPGDKFELESYGGVEIDGVPFELVDPQGELVANIIGLQRPFRSRQATLPESVTLDCSGQVSAIHMLGGVAWGAYPRSRNESTSMIVRCTYADGTTQDHELINGKHIVTYQEGNDVPESKVAVTANGKQIRYLKVPCDASKELTTIELVKGDDFSMPLVFALTVESADDNKQPSSPGKSDVSLKDVFQDAYFVGAAGDVPGRYSDDELMLARTHFNFWTPENCMKPAPIHPQEDEWRFERADALVDWCVQNAIQIHGHTLVWHSQTNDWFWRDGDKELTIERMKQHIHTLVGRYKGKIHSWDVVNEAINDRGDPTTENLRNSGWLRTIGPEFISLAFKFAHEADPDAVLYYNDYNIERGDKRACSMLLLKRLIDDGAPIHGVGIQGHWSTNNVPFEEIDKAISDYASLGLKVSITELDVTIRGASGGQFGRRFGRRRQVTPPSAEDLQKQAEAYSKLFAIFKKHEDKIERVTFWGLNDRRTWRWGQHPLLFDGNNNVKPAYASIVALAGSDDDTAKRAPEPPKNVKIEEGGQGDYSAIVTEAPTLAGMTIYRPEDLSAFAGEKKLPVLLWGNGACANTTEEHKNFLNEIASHGFIILGIGPLDQLQQRNETSRQRTNSSQLVAALDWIIAKDTDENSIYCGKIDTTKVAAMGMSCGGLQAIEISDDPRVTTTVVCNSGVLPSRSPMAAMPNLTKEDLKKFHSPVLYIMGGPSDIAYNNAMDDFSRVDHVPIVMTNLDVGHGGTYRRPHGGEYSSVALAWLNWQLKDDKASAKMFVGDDSQLKRDPDWTIDTKNLEQ